MEEPHPIGIVVRCLHHEIRRAISTVTTEELGDTATGVHSWVLRYLYDHSDRDVFQKDLESCFSVRRSTMTSILKLMEKNGMITREPVSYDARLKKLNLTPAAIEIQEKIRRQIDELEARMRNGISEEELNAFFATAEKIEANLQ